MTASTATRAAARSSPTARFRLGDGFVTDFGLEVASDDSFLQQYDYSDADRLTSFVRVSRTRADEYVELGAVGFQSLRDDEDTATVPFAFPVLNYRRLIEAPAIGGRVGIDAQLARHPARRRHQHGARRRRHRLAAAVAAAAGRARGDDRRGRCSTSTRSGTTRCSPTAPGRAACRPPPAQLRWPLVRATARAEHVIEPIAQVI